MFGKYLWLIIIIIIACMCCPGLLTIMLIIIGVVLGGIFLVALIADKASEPKDNKTYQKPHGNITGHTSKERERAIDEWEKKWRRKHPTRIAKPTVQNFSDSHMSEKNKNSRSLNLAEKALLYNSASNILSKKSQRHNTFSKNHDRDIDDIDDRIDVLDAELTACDYGSPRYNEILNELMELETDSELYDDFESDLFLNENYYSNYTVDDSAYLYHDDDICYDDL